MGIQEILKYALRIWSPNDIIYQQSIPSCLCDSYWRTTLNFILKLHCALTEMADYSGNQNGRGNNSLILINRALDDVITHTTCRWQLYFLHVIQTGLDHPYLLNQSLKGGETKGQSDCQNRQSFP